MSSSRTASTCKGRNPCLPDVVVKDTLPSSPKQKEKEKKISSPELGQLLGPGKDPGKYTKMPEPKNALFF